MKQSEQLSTRMSGRPTEVPVLAGTLNTVDLWIPDTMMGLPPTASNA
jgi:hypothetical protein